MPINRASGALFNTQKCSYLLLLFPCLAYDLLHVDVSSDLVVRAEPEAFMQGISKVSTCIRRHVAKLFTGAGHHHVPERIDYLITGIFSPAPLLQHPEYEQGYEAGDEMGFYPVFILKEYRACPELRLHDPEARLNLPALPVDVYNLVNAGILKVCADSIETVVHFLLTYCVHIKERDVF